MKLSYAFFVTAFIDPLPPPFSKLTVRSVFQIAFTVVSAVTRTLSPGCSPTGSLSPTFTPQQTKGISTEGAVKAHAGNVYVPPGTSSLCILPVPPFLSKVTSQIPAVFGIIVSEIVVVVVYPLYVRVLDKPTLIKGLSNNAA